MGYMLFINDRPLPPATSLEEAKKLGAQFVEPLLRIECWCASEANPPPVNQIWNYNRENESWDEVSGGGGAV